MRDADDDDDVEIDEVGFLVVVDDFVSSSRLRFKSSTYFDIMLSGSCF